MKSSFEGHAMESSFSQVLVHIQLHARPASPRAPHPSYNGEHCITACVQWCATRNTCDTGSLREGEDHTNSGCASGTQVVTLLNPVDRPRQPGGPARASRHRLLNEPARRIAASQLPRCHCLNCTGCQPPELGHAKFALQTAKQIISWTNFKNFYFPLSQTGNPQPHLTGTPSAALCARWNHRTG